jgi:hypothetical protein
MTDTNSTETSVEVKEKTKSINWVLAAATVVLGFLYIQKSWENSNLTLLNNLQDAELRIVDDECQEYRHQLSTMPTYEDGYKAALLKRNAGTYSDGYQDAKIVFDGSNNYAQGYHAAITQFGFLKDVNKESAEKIVKDAKPEDSAQSY